MRNGSGLYHCFKRCKVSPLDRHLIPRLIISKIIELAYLLSSSFSLVIYIFYLLRLALVMPVELTNHVILVVIYTIIPTSFASELRSRKFLFVFMEAILQISVNSPNPKHSNPCK